LLFKITGKHIDLTNAIRQYAEQKTSKLPKFYDSINRIEVILDGNPGGTGPSVNVELIARGEHSNVFVVSEQGEDAYQCIDIAVHKLERQLKKKKEKQRNNKHAGNGDFQ